MKILIVYYSRTGTTKKAALAIKDRLNCDLEEIVDKKDRAGLVGYLSAGRDAMRRILTEIEPVKYSPADYGLVVIATPVWVGTMAAPIRSYLAAQKENIKQLAFISTQGSRQRQRVFDDMAAITDKKPLSEAFFTTKEIVKGNYEEKLEAFVKALSIA
jgi:menaquinone-dependent protoporphyrinogen IX oxidase